MRMCVRAVFFIVATLAAAASAAPAMFEAQHPQCDTGPIQCCVDTYTTTDGPVTELTGLLGIALPTTEGHVGIGCTPITFPPTGGEASCAQQPVCCTDNGGYGGLIHFGCAPIDMGLRKPGRWLDSSRLVAAALDVHSFFPYWFE